MKQHLKKLDDSSNKDAKVNETNTRLVKSKYLILHLSLWVWPCSTNTHQPCCFSPSSDRRQPLLPWVSSRPCFWFMGRVFGPIILPSFPVLWVIFVCQHAWCMTPPPSSHQKSFSVSLDNLSDGWEQTLSFLSCLLSLGLLLTLFKGIFLRKIKCLWLLFANFKPVLLFS